MNVYAGAAGGQRVRSSLPLCVRRSPRRCVWRHATIDYHAGLARAKLSIHVHNATHPPAIQQPAFFCDGRLRIYGRNQAAASRDGPGAGRAVEVRPFATVLNPLRDWPRKLLRDLESRLLSEALTLSVAAPTMLFQCISLYQERGLEDPSWSGSTIAQYIRTLACCLLGSTRRSQGYRATLVLRGLCVMDAASEAAVVSSKALPYMLEDLPYMLKDLLYPAEGPPLSRLSSRTQRSSAAHCEAPAAPSQPPAALVDAHRDNDTNPILLPRACEIAISDTRWARGRWGGRWPRGRGRQP